MSAIIAASYGRTSGESGDSVSLDTQLKANRVFADAVDITIAYEFREEFTGTKIERPKLNEIRKLIAQGKINAIVVYATDRLARSEYVAQYLFHEVFVPNRIRLFIASGNKEIDPSSPESLLMWSVENMFSAYERNKIVERFTRAKREMRNEGLWVGESGATSYGYKKVGRRKDTKIELIPEEITVVTRIFELFLDGYSTLEIANILTTADIQPPSANRGFYPFHSLSKSTWSAAAVYHILKNEKYTGRWYANRFGVNGKKDRDEWVRIDLPHTAIISESQFQVVQARLADNRRKAGAETVNEYLLARRCTCGICGYSVQAYTQTNRVGKKYSYYGCNGRSARSRRLNPIACTLPIFKSPHVDALLWERITKFITDPIYRQETLDTALQQHKERYSDAIAMVEAVDRAKARHRDEILRLTSLFTEGDIDRDTFRTKKKEIEERYAAALSVESEYTDALQGTLTAKDVDVIEDSMRKLAQEFERMGDLSYKRKLQLIEAMDITGVFTVQDGMPRLNVYVYGANVESIRVTEPSDSKSILLEGCATRLLLFRIPLCDAA